MTFSHSMNAHVKFHTAVSKDRALAILAPLAGYFGWTSEMIENPDQACGEVVILNVSSDQLIQGIEIHTEGTVPQNFHATVEAFAASLVDVAAAGVIEVSDFDACDLSAAVREIWYGKTEQVLALKRERAISKATSELGAAGVDSATIAMVEGLVRNQAHPAITSADGTTGAGAAQSFWNEPLHAFESLRAISDEYGERTTADLFYLQNAILSSTFIEHWRQESKVVEVVDLLPSAPLWRNYIQSIDA